MPLRIEQHGESVRLWIKAVPGASRDQVGGVLGERLKVRVSAPPEGGRANDAICDLVARRLGVPRRRVSVESGHGSAEKTLCITGMALQAVRSALECD